MAKKNQRFSRISTCDNSRNSRETNYFTSDILIQKTRRPLLAQLHRHIVRGEALPRKITAEGHDPNPEFAVNYSKSDELFSSFHWKVNLRPSGIRSDGGLSDSLFFCASIPPLSSRPFLHRRHSFAMQR